MLTFVCILAGGQLPSLQMRWSKFGSMGEYPFVIDFCRPHSRWRCCLLPKLQSHHYVGGDCPSRAFGVTFFNMIDLPPNKALEPSAVGAFTLMITDNITSPSSFTLRSAAVAQLGR